MRFEGWCVVATLITILAVFAAYSGALGAPFIFDDYRAFVTNQNVQQANIAALWHEQGTRFIPYLTFAANAYTAPSATAFHVVNILIHLGGALTVGYLVMRLWQVHYPKKYWQIGEWEIPLEIVFGTSAALLFGLHPVTTQAVTYVVQRITSLATLLYVATLSIYLESRWRQKQALLAPALCTAILAMLSKEIAFTLPGAIFLAEWLLVTPQRELRQRRWGKAALFLLTLLVIPTILYWQRGPVALAPSTNQGPIIATPEYVAAPPLSRADYFFTEINVVRTYLRLSIAPLNLNIDYDYPISRKPFEIKTIASAILLIGLLGVGYRNHRQQPLIAFGIFFFFTTLLVESSLLPLEDVIFEHRLYLPLIGLVIAGLAASTSLPIKHISKTILVLVVIVTALGYLTWQRNLVWQNEVTLWQDTAQKSPAKARVYHSLGDAQLRAGDAASAATAYQQAIERDNHYAPAYNNLGLLRLGQSSAEAEALFKQAIAAEPEFVSAYANLGVALARQNKIPEAITAYEAAIRFNPSAVNAYYNLGKLYETHYQPALARDVYQLALKVDPNHLPTQAALRELEKILPRENN